MANAVKLSLCLASLLPALLAEAALPWNSQIRQPTLKSTDAVSFDPLSLLAVLWNPRASASAGRLYMQPDLKTFRWPHLLQIGAVLTPVSMLVSHATRNYGSTHPAVDMCAQTIGVLDVKSSIGASKNLFSKLPVMNSDLRLLEVINFKPSDIPTNDIMIVAVQSSLSTSNSQSPHWKIMMAKKSVLCTEIVMGIIVLSGTIFSSLLGDLWAVVLFASYTLYWVVSTAISFRQLNRPDASFKIKVDDKAVFAIFQRPVGGLVIFKGRQDILELWARSKWVFDHAAYHNFLHWAWMLTGSVAALASVACMVNMDARLQLAFLGMLLYASTAELWLTVLAHLLQTSSMTSLDFRSTKEVKRNDKRFKSIIQASLGLEKEYRLDKLRWVDLDLLPSTLVFKAMVETLDFLNGCNEKDDIVRAGERFHKRCEDEHLEANDIETRDSIWSEIETVWAQRDASKLPVQVQVVQV